MRKSVRGALVGAALLPLAVAAPAAAFAGGTGYDEGGKDKGHSKHEGDKDKGHHKKWDHKKHEDKKHDLALPAPLDSVVDLVTGATGGELPSLPSLPVG
ncbi:hypothetical protein Ae406Ps2_5752 [Pseudonocardia sp. Ae406_Ps2]|uniref:hypothetical protein n=1 Tax=unclassified Pseudonocardia TaxID=2619320 RepID=UPI00030B9149|nr:MULTISPECIES: hypothetical protein [unclassified Pseudonocardia]OLL96540.1 hypothetical protein Ae331Ps2_0207c [Pseudonocardia sp. Ae331_Ps2]OLM05752.1 hypothetical protein Ae406Ps2_5752 [Pseudonocardia sp. Ae406_Ps2]OLM15090.1 hypothetical protein Ae505Ps2_5222c [Pseudonocardia sp. Ae505_Ps2]OLM27328.1 hypothetical protein Ae706Ps2_5762 [Pseudonocardia sp. Ae706_Ps2]OLM30496.1 hypothetical protein Ae717Ps2_1391 [Pseudonocardia sp. Ae717_Ps2]